MKFKVGDIVASVLSEESSYGKEGKIYVCNGNYIPEDSALKITMAEEDWYRADCLYPVELSGCYLYEAEIRNLTKLEQEVFWLKILRES